MSDTPPGRILVVDQDWDTLEQLARALRTRGHHVVLAADGRAGLQRAVEIAADVVLVDRDVPVVDVRTFLEVLRDNPRTSGAHTFVMGTGDATRLAALGKRTDPIVKPFNSGEVTARIEEVLRARRAPRKETELRGDLAQVALFDLLQVFAANKRTGRLLVQTTGTDAEVWVRDGRVIDATFGAAAGEKALYRVLGVTGGRFIFVPNVAPRGQRIDAPTDQLLMEAVRQADELARLRDDLPPLTAQVGVAAPGARASGVATSVLQQLDEPRTLEELVDLVPAHDLQVLQAVRDLIASGALLILDPVGREVRLCEDDEVVAIRAAALRLRRPGVDGPVRLGVLCESSSAAARFGRALASVREFIPSTDPPAAAGDGVLGSLGVLRIGATDLEIFLLPFDAPMRPLWGTFLAPAAVALALGDAPFDEQAAELLRLLDVRLIPAPPGWESPSGAAGAVRAALGEIQAKTPMPT